MEAHRGSVRRHRARLGTSVVGAAFLAAVLAACSSSGGGASAAGGTPSGSAGAGGSAAQQVAAAQAAVRAAQVVPSKLDGRTPLNTTPPTGKTVVFMQCELEQCHQFELGVAQAVKVVGWNIKTINYKSSDNGSIVTAFSQALQYKPAAVMFLTGLGQLPSIEPEYEKAGVRLIDIAGLPQKPDSNVSVLLSGDYISAGSRALASWFIADSQAKGKALVVNVPYFGILDTAAKALRSTIASNCSGCSSSEVDITPSELQNNSTVATVVSAVRKDSGINYVLATDGTLVPGLRQALKTAGVSSSVKVGAVGLSAENVSELKQGNEQAGVETPDFMASWSALDTALRAVEGMPVPAEDDNGLPYLLITSDNLDQVDANGAANYPTDYQDLFKSLWKVQ